MQPPEIVTDCQPEQCRFPEPFQDRHHVYHPRREFKTGVEKKFRQLGCFVYTTCRCMHEEWDGAFDPPPKPPRDVMVQVIAEQAMGVIA